MRDVTDTTAKAQALTDAAAAPRATVSVRYVPAGRRRSFLLPDLAFDPPLLPGDAVVVHDGDALDCGTVVAEASTVSARRRPVGEPAPEVVRRMSAEDVRTRLLHQQKERDAFQLCQMKVRERRLDMKLTRVEHALDGSKLLFYYTADHRVDFRELVRDLAAAFRMRIEMRQIGVRDEARMLGGYGTCGRPLCCTTWLTSFEPVSIKMAKQQHLSLSPSKLSGVCGRLKCCLRYELPNAKGETHAGCGQAGSCEGGCAQDGSCGSEGGTCSCGA
jgi:cell fate regulator YaaT (PSP1 superfamily)